MFIEIVKLSFLPINVLAARVSLTGDIIFMLFIFLGWEGSRKGIVHKWGLSRINTFAYFAARRRHALGPHTLHVRSETADKRPGRPLNHLEGNPIVDVTSHDMGYSTGSEAQIFDFEVICYSKSL